jgi:PAS domain S-box-containing protein
MGFPFTGIRGRLLFISLLALLPTAALGWFEFAHQRRQAHLDAHGQLAQRARDDAERQAQRLRQARELLVTLAHLPQITEGDPVACRQLLAEVSERYRQYEQIAVYETDGRLRCATGQAVEDLEPSQLQAAAATRRFTLGRSLGQPGQIACAYPVVGANGAVGAVVATRLPLETQISDGTSIALLDTDGNLLAHGADRIGAPASLAAPLVSSSAIAEGPGLDGSPRVYAFQRVGLGSDSQGVLLAVSKTQAAMQALGQRQLVRELATLGGVSVLLLLGVSLVAHRLVVRPVDRLLLSASRLGDGDRAARTGLAHGDDELGRLARAYDEMADTLERSDTQLRLTLADLTETLAFRLLVESVKDYAIVMIDPEGRVVTWNQGAERIKGYQRAEILGRHISSFYTPEDLAAGRPERTLQAALAEGRCEDLEWRVRKDGSRFWATITTTSIRDHDGRLRGFSQVTRDLTERRQAEETLRGLSQRLLMAQEEERRRIARELHDEIGQVLTSVKFSLQSLERQPSGEIVKQRLESSVAHVDHAIQEVRDLSLQLRPSILDELGLPAALRWYLSKATREAPIKLRHDIEPFEERLPIEIEVACFRVMQEAFTNIVRHAKAANVEVELVRRAGVLELRVRDDGQGFDLKRARARAAGGECMGLSGMQERVSLVGGRVEMTSSPGAGTELRAWFPLTAEFDHKVDAASHEAS